MGRECPRCGRWLSGGNLIEGYCWDCKRPLSAEEIAVGFSPEAYRQEQEEDSNE